MEWVKQIEGDFEFTDLWARYAEIVGFTIRSINMGGSLSGDDQSLFIHFNEGRILEIKDGGQSCCESRYMTCDDDLSGHEGGQLLSIDLDAADPKPVLDYARPETDDYGECHETQFVKVQTTKGSFTLCTHNVHNGYYGGFSLSAKLHR
jgi:hypothetical protein